MVAKTFITGAPYIKFNCFLNNKVQSRLYSFADTRTANVSEAHFIWCFTQGREN